MKICVLQPDYARSTVDYQHYDPARDLARLVPEHEVHHVALDKRSTYRQLKALAGAGYDIFVNLCEGYLEWDIPSIDVIHTLELLHLPYTGPTPTLYNPTKPLMKYVAHTVGVPSAAHVLVRAAHAAAIAVVPLVGPQFHVGRGRVVREVHAPRGQGVPNLPPVVRSHPEPGAEGTRHAAVLVEP